MKEEDMIEEIVVGMIMTEAIVTTGIMEETVDIN